MRIYGKGSDKNATNVLFVKSTKLYVDAAKTVEVKRSQVLSMVANGKLFIDNGTSYVLPTSVKLDGSQVVVGETTYSIAADA